ncbi:MAG: hypothetical protein NC081_08045 [Roseburia sp.]|nr:hypothetical protein [Roseburia sp.]
MRREKREKWFRKFPRWAAAAFLALLLELTVCQYGFYLTAWGEAVSPQWSIVSGGRLQEDGSILVTEKPLVVEITRLEELTRDICTIRTDILREAGTTGEKQPFTTIQIYAGDEGSQDYYVLSPYRDVLPEVTKSQYFRPHTYGVCERLAFYIYGEAGDTVRIEELSLNAVIPMSISWLRILLLFLTGVFLFYAWPFGTCCTVKKTDDSKLQRGITAAVLALQIGLFIGAALLNQRFRELPPEWKHHMQYHELAVALSKGQLYLEELPADAMNVLPNPYDFTMREKFLAANHAAYRWDTAYYNNKYYVYFGVVPVMVFYLPWYLVTGTAFPTWLGIAITGVVFVLAAFRLSADIIRKYFKGGVPYLAWLLATLLFVNGSGVLTMMRRPDYYSLPILMGITLSLLGLDFWITSLKEEGVSAGRLGVGCLCMALVAGCRPQLVLGSFLIFPIYWEAVFQKRQLFSRNSKGKTGLAIAAYGVVAVCLMLYNQRRFGSPFDFGANYNLTTNDMTRRGFVGSRIPVGIFRFLLQPPALGARFPFVESTSDWTSYVGQSISEPTFGGFLPVSLLVVAGLFILAKRKWFSRKNIWALSLLSAVLGLAVVCVDVQGAGILLRYFGDFGWLFYLSALIAWFAAWEHNGGVRDRALCLCGFQNVAFMVGMAFWLLLLFTDGSDKLVDADPVMFYEFFYQLAFWS